MNKLILEVGLDFNGLLPLALIHIEIQYRMISEYLFFISTYTTSVFGYIQSTCAYEGKCFEHSQMYKTISLLTTYQSFYSGVIFVSFGYLYIGTTVRVYLLSYLFFN